MVIPSSPHPNLGDAEAFQGGAPGTVGLDLEKKKKTQTNSPKTHQPMVLNSPSTCPERACAPALRLVFSDKSDPLLLRQKKKISLRNATAPQKNHPKHPQGGLGHTCAHFGHALTNLEPTPGPPWARPRTHL